MQGHEQNSTDTVMSGCHTWWMKKRSNSWVEKIRMYEWKLHVMRSASLQSQHATVERYSATRSASLHSPLEHFWRNYCESRWRKGIHAQEARSIETTMPLFPSKTMFFSLRFDLLFSQIALASRYNYNLAPENKLLKITTFYLCLHIKKIYLTWRIL